jgi:benzaldehyde dehydrogenase (NAD)
VFGAEWRDAAGGSLDVLEPATGNKITSVGNASAADVRQAAREARAAQPGWAATPYEERAAILRKAARALEDNQEELIPWIARETGGIPAKAGFEIHMVTEILYRSAAMCTEPQGVVLPSNPGRISIARRVPRGVIGIISPFNFPLILSTRAVAPALATGNTVVLKPDPRTVMTGGFIIARIFEEAGLPKGVLHVLPGGVEAGEAICTDPDIAMVSFTGSSNIGRRIGELAGKHLKKVQLELGGVWRLVPSGSNLHDHRPHIGQGQDRCIADGETGGEGEPSAGWRSAGTGCARTDNQQGASPTHRRHREGLGEGGREIGGRRDL